MGAPPIVTERSPASTTIAPILYSARADGAVGGLAPVQRPGEAGTAAADGLAARRNTASTRATSSWMSNGLAMKSSAPSFKLRIRSRCCLVALRMMIGPGHLALISEH